MPKSHTSKTAPKRSSQAALAHVTAEIASFLERGVMPWRAPWDPERALALTPGLPLRATGQPYRGANVFLLWATQLSRGYSKRTWLTLRQAATFGGRVRKGEKACPIVFYGQATAKDAPESRSGNVEEGRESYRFLKLFHVFNLEQIDHLPAHIGAEPDISAPVSHPALHDWVVRAGARVRVGGQVACYSPAIDTILLPHISAFRSEEHWAATLAHESIHWTGAQSRLDRLGDYFTDRKARAREELCAELGAAMIGAMTGHAPSHLEDHASYIADWLKLVREEPKAFLSAGAKAQAAIDYLVTHAGHPAETRTD